MVEVELDTAQDHDELLERIDIILENGLRLISIDCYKRSRKIVIKIER